MKSKHPVFLKSISGLIFAMALGFLLFTRSEKSKSSFQNVRGIITSFGNSNESFPDKDSSKFRYLQIGNFPKTFELFIGKGSGDFKPKFEKIDDLKIGDSVTIYFDENLKTQQDPINRLAYFIDKGEEAIFIKGDFEKYLAYFIIGISLISILTLVMLKRKGKII
jgi:hypothetical protein